MALELHYYIITSISIRIVTPALKHEVSSNLLLQYIPVTMHYFLTIPLNNTKNTSMFVLDLLV